MQCALHSHFTVQGDGQALEEVLASCNRVLAWLLQRHIYDPRGEFFIVRKEGEDEETVVVGKCKGEFSRCSSRI